MKALTNCVFSLSVDDDETVLNTTPECYHYRNNSGVITPTQVSVISEEACLIFGHKSVMLYSDTLNLVTNMLVIINSTNLTMQNCA